MSAGVAAAVIATGMLGGAQAPAASAGAQGREQFLVSQIQFPIPLVVSGERVEIGYDAQKAPNVVETPSAIGTLYVRNDRQRNFTAVPLRIRKALQRPSNDPDHVKLRALVPDRLIRGNKLLYYAVIRNRRLGRSVTVPAGGARAPESAWIINNAHRVDLGTHVFGSPQAPETFVARATTTEVGFGRNGLVFGPRGFEVATDRSVWLWDSVNGRILTWTAADPNRVARTVRLPFPASDFAVGPAGSLYLLRGALPGSRSSRLTRLSAGGRALWTSRIGGGPWLRNGPDGTLYATGPAPEDQLARYWWGDHPWVPVATPAGRPLSIAAQRRGTLRAQPLTGGLRLVAVSASYDRELAPHEARVALINRAGRVVRAWRVRSRTVIRWEQQRIAPALVGGDPVIVPEAIEGAGNRRREYLVLRLGPRGDLRTRFTLPKDDPPRSAYGDSPTADVRVESHGKLYQLGSAPGFGAAVYRHALARTR